MGCQECAQVMPWTYAARMTGMTAPRLTIELVPATQWGANLRAVLRPGEWRRCREFAQQKSGELCGICGRTGRNGRLECHELWQFDDERHQQRLVGLIALCPSCHLVKHFGRAVARGFAGEANDQLMFVNRWTAAEAEHHVEESRLLWEQRSQYRWQLDVSWLTQTLGMPVDLSTMPAEPTADGRWRPNRSGPRARLLDSDYDQIDTNPFAPGTQEFVEHEMYEQMLAERDWIPEPGEVWPRPRRR